MSLYADYLQECGHVSIIETDKGFVTYRIMGQECYIPDIYIVPEHRKSHGASELADKVTEEAKKHGCSILTGSVNMNIKDPTRSLSVLLAYGFKVLKSSETGIILGKDI